MTSKQVEVTNNSENELAELIRVDENRTTSKKKALKSQTNLVKHTKDVNGEKFSQKAKESSKRHTIGETFNVVKSITNSLSSNFDTLNNFLTRNFSILGENMQVLNDNLQQFIYPSVEEDMEQMSEGFEEAAREEQEVNEANSKASQNDSVSSLLASLEKKASNKDKTDWT